MNREVIQMKQVGDQSLFLPEFQRLIGSQKFDFMAIDEDENEMVIRLRKQDGSERIQKRERLLKTLEQPGGVLKRYPGASEELHAIARRDEEDDRDGSHFE
ncbi:hypothetical protein C1I59_00735 [Paenibacillus polymyxa]|uniref:hypothetical protein n=1 Tax=Paenibacillus polymyxa TaxID=1406 RepID=UPI0010BE7DD5|nr:hypothetical protein [Paenibacillus polymyxa]TKH40221.1 hypothetical protein C1I59_00735 [Paenibacillus polymyxa]